MKKLLILPALLGLGLGLAANPAAAEIEWQAGPALKTTATPMAVATSANGSRTFILGEGGKVQIFDQAGNLRDAIDVDPGMDHIASDGDGNRIIVSSRKNGVAQPIDISYRFPFDYSDSPYLGKTDAPVVLTLFSDFQCPYCSTVKTQLDQLLEKNPDTLRIVYKAYPLPSHKMSMPAVLAAFAANRQGHFWDLYEKLYSDFRNLSPERIKLYASELKMDMAQYEKDLADRKVQAQVGRDLREARMSGVGGTPTMFINGLLVQNRSPQGMQEMIDKEVSKRAKAK